MTPPLHEQVVVVTGASSGIGRATALEFARRGSKVVLAARNESALNMVVREIEAEGGSAIAVPTDVSIWDDVQRLAAEAVNQYGRIDTWVNDVGVSVYGEVHQVTFEEFERVMHVNVMSQVYGVRAVIPYMRLQGGGTIINIGSVLSIRAIPMQAAYVASKFAVKGFTDALRMELMHEGTGINVMLIMPSSINTPFFRHARSKMGEQAAPVPPTYTPEDVAHAIVAGAARPKRETFVGSAGVLFHVLEFFMPTWLDRIMITGGLMYAAQKSGRPAPDADALYSPVPESVGQIHGEFKSKPSLYTRLVGTMPGWGRAILAPVLFGSLIGLVRRYAR